MRDFLQYWKTYDHAKEYGTPLRFSASSQFRRRRLDEGDRLWLVTILNHRLTLLGDLLVDDIFDRAEAQATLGDQVYDADYYAISIENRPRHILECDIQRLAPRLRFVGGVERLQLSGDGAVDGKSLQSLRELTPDSVEMLQEALEKDRRPASPRNPVWSTDELILALDVYFKTPPWTISGRHPEIRKLSEELRQLAAYENPEDAERYRNQNGVYMKLMNFQSLDPKRGGKGLKGAGREDRRVWDRYAGDPVELEKLATDIRALLGSREVVVESLDEDLVEAPEGKLLTRYHRVRERDPRLVKAKKTRTLRKGGHLRCEVCCFDFYAVYGELGKEYIECHHTTPLAVLRETKRDWKILRWSAQIVTVCYTADANGSR